MNIDKNISISYLGPEASFSHICAQSINTSLNLNAKLKQYFDFKEILNSLINEEVEFALLPLENSLGGNVSETLDMLWSAPDNISVQLEWVLKIQHNLISYADSMSDIKEIRAHPQAFLQCKEFIDNNFPKDIVKTKVASNSGGVSSLIKLNEEERKSVAAIGSMDSADYYQIPIVKESVNDQENNYTRFWLLGNNKHTLPKAQTTQQLISIAFRLPADQPGGLINVLKPLSEHNINLSKIVSRPTKGRLCEYTFYIDFVHKKDTDFQIQDISNICSEYRLMGDYIVLPEGDARF